MDDLPVWNIIEVGTFDTLENRRLWDGSPWLFQSLASPELSWEPCSSSCCQVYGDDSNLALETAG